MKKSVAIILVIIMACSLLTGCGEKPKEAVSINIKLPVLTLPAKNDPECDETGRFIEKEAREAGVTAFISKPLFPTDLRNVLNQCCGSAAEDAAAAETVYDFTGKKILLVEDNEMNREIALDILEEDGFILDTAENGSIAVEKLKAAAPGQYDLILMDIQMPVMDGYEATKQIRALPDPGVADITIVAMTANAFEEDRQARLQPEWTAS